MRWKSMLVAAPSLDAAQQIALRAGLVRRLIFRQVRAISPTELEVPESERAAIMRMLDEGGVGVLEKGEQGWAIDPRHAK